VSLFWKHLDAARATRPARRVSLAGSDVYLFVSIFILTVDDALPVECVVLVEWLVRSEAVNINRRRVLFAVVMQESNRRFDGGFRWVNAGLVRSTVSEDEHRWLVLLILHARVWTGHASMTATVAAPSVAC